MNINYLLQPIVDVHSGDVLHYEVLSRPKDLGGAESLEAYFETMAPATQMAIIQDQLECFAPYQIPLAINVSSSLLADPEQCFRLIELVGDHQMPVLLEFTEGTPLPPAGIVNPYFNQLRTVGCRVALDDFGAGCNQDIAGVQNYDFDVIKIDRSVSNRWNDPRRKASLSLLAQVIKMLGKTAIAEGIETQEQADSLSAMGFNQQQGYFHCRPGTMQEVRYAVGSH